jgi:antibiotic biosynthesis monooxygenase (ABM) superfamily enzyme
MIPTMIVFGLVFGRWWKLAIAVGAVLWPTILVFTGVIGVADVLGAAAFGALNTAVGVAVHQVALLLVRSIRRDRPTPRPS